MVIGHGSPLRRFIFEAIAVPVESVFFHPVGAVPYQSSNNRAQDATSWEEVKKRIGADHLPKSDDLRQFPGHGVVFIYQFWPTYASTLLGKF
jgi:hypothetical protein